MAAYCRVSTQQEIQHHSLEAQREYYEKLITSNPGWEFAGIYADEASGRNNRKMYDFQRMMGDCRAGKIDLIVTKSISRLGRNTLQFLNACEELKALDVDVLFEVEKLYLHNPKAVRLLTIYASVYQNESEVKSAYTRWGIRTRLPELMPANDITTHATFTANKYLVTFIIDEEVIAADSLEYGSTIVAPEAPQREGYTFDGWGEVAETVPAGDVTYEGSYSVNIYKVYYYVGEELVYTAEVAYGEAIPEYVYEPTTEGDVFMGWTGELYETMPAHDVTYRANIENGIGQLTIDNAQFTIDNSQFRIDNAQLTIYDLHGRRIQRTDGLTRGVYIVNGRKVVVR